jgi:thiamine monophosphate synthase
MAGVPVVAIGGVLQPDQARDAARCGVDGVCIVPALRDAPTTVVTAFQRALAEARFTKEQDAVPAMPLSSLVPAHLGS